MFSKLLTIIIISCAAFQHILMISEGSCDSDTEDWGNGPFNYRNVKITLYSNCLLFQIVIIFYNITVFIVLFYFIQ